MKIEFPKFTHHKDDGLFPTYFAVHVWPIGVVIFAQVNIWCKISGIRSFKAACASISISFFYYQCSALVCLHVFINFLFLLHYCVFAFHLVMFTAQIISFLSCLELPISAVVQPCVFQGFVCPLSSKVFQHPANTRFKDLSPAVPFTLARCIKPLMNCAAAQFNWCRVPAAHCHRCLHRPLKLGTPVGGVFSWQMPHDGSTIS